MLNWNDVRRTKQAVASLLRQAAPPQHVVLVDNGSAGDDARTLADFFRDDPVSVIALPANVGFARAVNVGAVAAMRGGARYILLFNNDARIDADSTAIAQSVMALEADSSLGAAGPLICNDDEKRTLQSSTYNLSMWFPVPRANRAVVRKASLKATSYLSGSCLLLRAHAFAAVGGLDPDYFLYGDDVDFARRLYAAGYSERLILAGGVKHVRAAATQIGSKNYIYTALRSNLILVKKHARWYQLPSAVATCVAASVALAALGVTRGHGDAPFAVFRAWRDFLAGRWGGYAGSKLASVKRPTLQDSKS